MFSLVSDQRQMPLYKQREKISSHIFCFYLGTQETPVAPYLWLIMVVGWKVIINHPQPDSTCTVVVGTSPASVLYTPVRGKYVFESTCRRS